MYVHFIQVNWYYIKLHNCTYRHKHTQYAVSGNSTENVAKSFRDQTSFYFIHCVLLLFFSFLNAYEFSHLSQCGCSRSQRASEREREQLKMNRQNEMENSVAMVVVAVVLG